MENGKVKIREAIPDDCEQIAVMIQELADYEKISEETNVTADQLRKDGFEEQKWFHCFVAEDEDNLIGYALYYFCYSTWVGVKTYLEDLYVKSAYRNKGIGTKLFRSVARAAVERKCTRLDWTVLGWNKTSIDFYKKTGAVNLTSDKELNSFRLSGDTLCSFVNNSRLKKLDSIQEQLSSLNQKISVMDGRVTSLEESMSKTNDRLNTVENSRAYESQVCDDLISKQSEIDKVLQKERERITQLQKSYDKFKSVPDEITDLQSRSMRDNLLFFGFDELSTAESRRSENCANTVLDYRKNTLKIVDPESSIKIERAHRLRNKYDSTKSRPIVEFVDYGNMSEETNVSSDRLRKDGFGEQKLFQCFVADYKGNLAGYATYYFGYSTRVGVKMYLGNLYVRPAYRNKGIGTKLFRSVARVAVERKCNQLDWIVRGWNKDAIEFYKKTGAMNLSNEKEWNSFRLSGEKLCSFINNAHYL
ncbi:uncharacterized protein LOC123527917 [Mercenaria mercenaria]|uniref:uncharacterized protein LOC123527917 n=1 Tax=Mercenaria mercenaria TaxID=6596 RepID=UPI00234F637F|nr:uncharacterized protein LOC123527917 [Mercenaria mercenaria]